MASGRCCVGDFRVFLAGCANTGSHVLPGTGGLRSPLMRLNQARNGIAGRGIGAAMACNDCALEYALLRKQFRDQPIAPHELVQEKLAWMINEITKGNRWFCRSGG